MHIGMGLGIPFNRNRDRSSKRFSPRDLFRNSEQGAWYDVSDLSTLFQDSAGTTPVTAVGQLVGLMLDKSGRGNHASQTTATSRPILQQDEGGRYYLYGDGVDDSLVTPDITLTSEFFYSLAISISGGQSFAGPFEMIRQGGQIGVLVDSILQDYSNSPWRRRVLIRRASPGSTGFDDNERRSSFGTAHVSWADNGANLLSGDLYPGSVKQSVNSGPKSFASETGRLHLMRGYMGNHMLGRFYGGVFLMRSTTLDERDKLNASLMSKAGVTL